MNMHLSLSWLPWGVAKQRAEGTMVLVACATGEPPWRIRVHGADRWLRCQEIESRDCSTAPGCWDGRERVRSELALGRVVSESTGLLNPQAPNGTSIEEVGKRSGVFSGWLAITNM